MGWLTRVCSLINCDSDPALLQRERGHAGKTLAAIDSVHGSGRWQDSPHRLTERPKSPICSPRSNIGASDLISPEAV